MKETLKNVGNMFRVNDKNTRIYFTPFSSVSIAAFNK